MKNFLKDMPIAICAISLGFMGLATAFVGLNILWIRHIAVLFSIICIGIIIAKYIFHNEVVLTEMKHPVLGSVYPTICMTLMVVSVYINDFSVTLGKGIWFIAIILHFMISILFFKEMLREFKLEDMIPGWFIPTVGIGVGAVTSETMGMPIFSDIVFYYSLFMFIVITPIMIYRLRKCCELKGPAKATIMIFTAPASVCLAGGLATNNIQDNILITFLAISTYISVACSFILLSKLIKEKSLAYLAPLTFPLSISVVACQRYVGYLVKINSPLQGVCRAILYIQYVVATLVILYVVIKTIYFLVENINKKNNRGLNT